ncbi:hypothetical protein B0919_03610 [Hymenobacter sp. CRA2]|nr:hypothetical protein B0919_03610 [Hymenobacter sp. CRA2]
MRIVWHPNAAGTMARRELMEEALQWLIESGKGKVLADQRFMVPFSTAEQQWLTENWTPRAVEQGGYRCRAILAARDAVARLASASVMMSARGQINYCYFDNEEEAVAWLLAH